MGKEGLEREAPAHPPCQVPAVQISFPTPTGQTSSGSRDRAARGDFSPAGPDRRSRRPPRGRRAGSGSSRSPRARGLLLRCRSVTTCASAAGRPGRRPPPLPTWSPRGGTGRRLWRVTAAREAGRRSGDLLSRHTWRGLTRTLQNPPPALFLGGLPTSHPHPSGVCPPLQSEARCTLHLGQHHSAARIPLQTPLPDFSLPDHPSPHPRWASLSSRSAHGPGLQLPVVTATQTARQASLQPSWKRAPWGRSLSWSHLGACPGRSPSLGLGGRAPHHGAGPELESPGLGAPSRRAVGPRLQPPGDGAPHS